MSSATFSSSSTSAGLVRPKRVFLTLSALCGLGVAGALTLVATSGAYPLVVLTLPLLLFGAMAARYALSSTTDARVVPGSLRVDGEGRLFLRREARSEELLARREELVQGAIVPTDEALLVRLERRRGPALLVRVRDEAEGQALLHALGFDAEHVAAQMHVSSGLVAMSVGRQLLYTLGPAFIVQALGMAFLFAFGKEGAPVFVGSIVALMAWILSIGYWPTTVRVGTDGIYTRWLTRERFTPLDRIRIATTYDEIVSTKRQHGVKLTLTNGEELRIPTGQTDIGASDARRLHHRIYEAMTARGSGAKAPTATLARGSRPVLEWIRELKRVGSGVVDHRTQALPLDSLLGVVEDASASGPERAGAALAAVSAADAAAKDRVRIAAETSASPKLRIALTRIADEAGDEELAAALEELDETRAGER